MPYNRQSRDSHSIPCQNALINNSYPIVNSLSIYIIVLIPMKYSWSSNCHTNKISLRSILFWKIPKLSILFQSVEYPNYFICQKKNNKKEFRKRYWMKAKILPKVSIIQTIKIFTCYCGCINTIKILSITSSNEEKSYNHFLWMKLNPSCFKCSQL